MRAVLSIVCTLMLVACTNQPGNKLTLGLQAQVDSIREQYNFPGMTVSYVFDNGASGDIASGLADVEAKVAMTTRTRMLGASTGKSFIAALALELAQEGRLTLDEPVKKWFGKYDWFKRVANHDTMTVRHLLTHSAGIVDHVHMPEFQKIFAKEWRVAGNPFPPQRLIEFILDVPAKFPAGSGWSYSDTGYILLGMVLEQVTGRPCFVEIQQRFLKPLKLVDTSPAEQRIMKMLAVGYMSPDNPFGLPARTLDEQGRLYWHPGVEWTGGGLVTTSHDLARWGTALFTGKAMPGDYLPQLLQGVRINKNASQVRYGSGVVIYDDTRNGPMYGHSGWIPGYVSSFRYYRDKGLTIAFQINTDIGIIGSDENIIRKIEDRLFKVLLVDAE